MQQQQAHRLEPQAPLVHVQRRRPAAAPIHPLLLLLLLLLLVALRGEAHGRGPQRAPLVVGQPLPHLGPSGGVGAVGGRLPRRHAHLGGRRLEQPPAHTHACRRAQR